jgi:hypothetical protein
VRWNNIDEEYEGVVDRFEDHRVKCITDHIVSRIVLCSAI